MKIHLGRCSVDESRAAHYAYIRGLRDALKAAQGLFFHGEIMQRIEHLIEVAELKKP